MPRTWLAASIVVILGLTSAAVAPAQWVKQPAAGIRRLADGSPDLSGPTPRTLDGKPDLSGIWVSEATSAEEMNRLFPFLKTYAVPGDDLRFFPKYFVNVFADTRPEDVPLRPDAARLFKERFASFGRDNPTARCLPPGIPMGDLVPGPRRFIQLADVLIILNEHLTHFVSCTQTVARTLWILSRRDSATQSDGG